MQSPRGTVTSISIDDAAATRARAFARCYEQHHQDLRRFVARRCGPELADEVVAETFSRSWSAAAASADPPSRAWLFGCAKNVLLEQHRRARIDVRTAAALATQRQTVPDHADETDLRLDVWRALRQLSDADRELLLLVEWDRLTPQEAALVLGCSPTALRVRLLRARRRFATHWSRSHGDEGASSLDHPATDRSH